MTMIVLVSLLVCLIGLVAYALSANAKIVELGRIAFFCGLLVTLFAVSHHVVALP